MNISPEYLQYIDKCAVSSVILRFDLRQKSTISFAAMAANEIVDFCLKSKRKITLDTAHLSMYCRYSGDIFMESVRLLSPIVAHWHMSDAKGTNGEGVEMGTGDIDFSEVLKLVTREQSFIVETWQGLAMSQQ